MKTNFTRLLSLMALFFIVLNSSAQDAYRTNVATGAFQWTTLSTWQRYDVGTSTWVAASVIPTASNASTITISAGDSIQLSGGTSNISIDEVVIETGGILVIFNNTAGAVTLNDGPGDDMIVNGKFYSGGTANITGTGHIQVSSTGLFTTRNTGVISNISMTNNGEMNFGGAAVAGGTYNNVNFINNNKAVWLAGAVTFNNNSIFTNNGTFTITSSSNWIVTAGGSQIESYGPIEKTTTSTITIQSTVRSYGTTNTVDVQGTINGQTIGFAGTLTLNNATLAAAGSSSTTGTVIGTGTINTFLSSGLVLSPGIGTTTAGNITVSDIGLGTVNISLVNDGHVAGVNYDYVNLSGSPIFLNFANLIVTDATSAADPVGTTYTILNSNASFSTQFASVTMPSNFSITYNSNSIVLTKIALQPLPVSWGSFNAVSKGSKVSLDWTTLMEENTSHFIVEHATDPAHFSAIARLEAKGNSTYTANYQFIFNTPDLSKTNFFRIKQVDLDGKSSYSATRSVKFDKGLAVAIQVYPNPVKDLLQLNIQRENIQVMLVDQSGRTLQQRSVQPGQSTIDMQSLPTGIYQLVIFEKGVRIDAKKIVKQ